MAKHPYEALLDSFHSPIKTEWVGSVRWGWANRQPISHVIVEWWISKGLIEESKPGTWVKAGEIQKCEKCGQLLPEMLGA